MKARGKHKAELSASPLVAESNITAALKGRNTPHISALQALALFGGRRASRFAPGFHIQHLRRWRGEDEVLGVVSSWGDIIESSFSYGVELRNDDEVLSQIKRP